MSHPVCAVGLVNTYTNALAKDMNSHLLPPTMDKWGKLGSLALVKQPI